MTIHTRRRIPLRRPLAVARLAMLLAAASAAAVVASAPASAPARGPRWRDDPAWHQGKAEWALYDAVRPIYGRARRYEATLFTNRQHMDPATTTKAAAPGAPGAFEVFKHNLSETIPTENYAYRFLTTCFVRADTMEPYKVVASTQDDCGATYKEFLVDGGTVRSEQFCYFPGGADGGRGALAYDRPPGLRFHDALSLTLRDYPFDDPARPVLVVPLVPDQTDSHATGRRPAEARVTYVGREPADVPLGTIDAHHLRVEHERHGGTTRSDYWLAADPALRHVMVRYEGPFGVRYALKRLAWWAYWSEPRPE